MARSAAKQKSDELRNIRRRYERQAQRLEKRAENATPTDARYLRRAAEQARNQASKFYAKNITDAKPGTAKYAQAISNAISAANVSKSKATLELNIGGSTDRNNMVGRLLLKGSAGSRFFAGTIEIWRGKTDYGERLQAVMDYFGVDNVLDAIKEYNSLIGDDVTDESGSESDIERYQRQTRKGILNINVKRTKAKAQTEI